MAWIDNVVDGTPPKKMYSIESIKIAFFYHLNINWVSIGTTEENRAEKHAQWEAFKETLDDNS
jgi:hypothetical protein